MAKRIWILFLCVLTLTGCGHHPSREEAIENWAVVTEITITCEDSGTLTRHIYTSPDKMRLILNCIRQLGQRSNPDIDPEQLPARTYCVILHHSDGSQRIYCLKADRYLRICRGPWQQVDPEKAIELTFLFQGLPSDDPTIGPRQGIPRFNTHFNLKSLILNCKTPPDGVVDSVILGTKNHRIPSHYDLHIKIFNASP